MNVAILAFVQKMRFRRCQVLQAINCGNLPGRGCHASLRQSVFPVGGCFHRCSSWVRVSCPGNIAPYQRQSAQQRRDVHRHGDGVFQRWRQIDPDDERGRGLQGGFHPRFTAGRHRHGHLRRRPPGLLQFCHRRLLGQRFGEDR